ncbi:MAG: methylated-DNA--[protein]-cysteine S-methyltransferase [Haliscomenobacter sp.]|nr:methylated-DNA--[protein]-cysteine S-methyltransferase [Haliscomenobacter sp.]
MNNPASRARRWAGQCPQSDRYHCARHRCIAKSGDLQGYFYGLDMKRALLELENPASFARQGTLF